MKKVFVLLITLVLSVSLFASATEAYSDFKDAVGASDIESAKSAFMVFIGEKNNEMRNLRVGLEKAVEAGNRRLAGEIRSEIDALSKLSMSREDTDALLAIIETNGNIEDAEWLYSASPFYRPSAVFDASSSGDGYSYKSDFSITVKPGSLITLPTENNVKIKGVGILEGWEDENGIVYAPGETIEMPIGGAEFKAVWTCGIVLKDRITGYTSSFTALNDGDIVTLPVLDAPGDSYVFNGWVEETTGEYIGPTETSVKVKGNGGSYIALWKALSIAESEIRVPVGRRVLCSVRINNIGNEDIKSATLKITDETGSVVAGPETRISKIGPNGIVVGNIPILVKESGTYPVTVTVTDRDNDVWTGTVSIVCV